MGKPLMWTLAAAVLVYALPAVFGDYGFYLGASLCVWMIFALAYDLAFGRAGLVSFGHAMFFGIGAYGFVLPILHWGWGFWSAIGFSLLVTGVFAVAVGFVALKVRGHSFVIITIIFSAIVELVAFSQSEITNGEDGFTFSLDSLALGPFDVSLTNAVSRYYFFVAVLVLVFLLLRWINESSLGRSFRAIKENEQRANLLGYPVQHYKLAAFTLSGALSGFAGALFSIVNFHVSAELFQIIVSVNPLTAVLVGGAGTMLGPVIGTTVIFVLHDTLRSYFIYADFVIGAILVLAVLFAPRGIVGIFATRRAGGPHLAPPAASREAQA